MNSNITSVEGYFAVWQYDMFPFLLGGTVTHVDSNGRCCTKEYGFGYWFSPIKIMSVNDGKDLIRKLRDLERDKRIEKNYLDKAYSKSLNAILSEFNLRKSIDSIRIDLI